jgi:DNA-directed RNA polymerase subunit RPC12/RpoP
MSENFNDTTNCPNCGDQNAYFNGYNYECPDCGYEWFMKMKKLACILMNMGRGVDGGI